MHGTAVKMPQTWLKCPFCGIYASKIHDHLFPCPVCKIYHSTLGPTNGRECHGLLVYLATRDK